MSINALQEFSDDLKDMLAQDLIQELEGTSTIKLTITLNNVAAQIHNTIK